MTGSNGSTFKCDTIGCGRNAWATVDGEAVCKKHDPTVDADPGSEPTDTNHLP